MKRKFKKCTDCVNFIEEEGNKVSCDYEYFENVQKYKAIVYVPEMFDCDKHEIIEE